MRIKLINYLAMSLVIITVSCKKNRYIYPDEPVKEISAEDLKQKAGVEQFVGTVYEVLSGQIDQTSQAYNSPPSNWTFGDVISDDAYKGGGGIGDQQNMHKMEIFSVDASSIDAKRKWVVSYEGVKRANAAINLLKESKGYATADRDARIAEMRFLRGHFYFELKKIFNKIPYLDENAVLKESFEISNEALNSTQLWAKIEDDFKAASVTLPVSQTDKAKPTRYAAWAYLCKTYIFQKKWAEANAAADEVINKGGYSLMPNFSDVFLPENDNGPEIIFAIQNDLSDAGVNPFAGGIGDRLLNIGGPFWPGADQGFLRPSQNLVNFFRVNESGYPARSNRDVKETDFVDPRLDHTIARPGITYLDLPEVYSASWTKEVDTYGPYSMKKRMVSPLSSHWLKNSPFTNDLNYYIIRYADVLLWKAEAAMESGDLATCRTLINQIRNRAKTGKRVQKPSGGDAANYKVEEYSFNFSCFECAEEALRDERRLEFALEGHRFFDLVRWGHASLVMNTYLSVEQTKRSYLTGVSFANSKNEYQPIPETEINLSKGVLKQNPGY